MAALAARSLPILPSKSSDNVSVSPNSARLRVAQLNSHSLAESVEDHGGLRTARCLVG